MKHIFSPVIVFLILIVTVVLGGAYFLMSRIPADQMVSTVALERVSQPDLNFSFGVPSGDEGLSFTQSLPNLFSGQELQKAFVLMKNSDSNMFFSTTTDQSTTETPPAISILVFNYGTTTQSTSTENLDAQGKLELWAREHDGYTAISLATSPITKVDIDGAPAIQYTTEGLYPQDIYLARYSGRMYLFVGQSLSNGDILDTSFEQVVDSVLFE